MICLDNTDTLEGSASVTNVVDYTVHGLVGTTFTNIAQGQLSDAAGTVLYAAGAAISIVSVIFVNTHNAAVTVELALDPANAGTPRRLIPKSLSLGVGYSMHFDGQRITVMDANGGIVSGVNVSDEAYDEATWNGVTNIAPSKNAVRDKFESFSSKIVQVVNTIKATLVSGDTQIPVDNTIPQNTEGVEMMTLAITPTNANNKLLIKAVLNIESSAIAHIIMAMFQDATANALAVTWGTIIGANYCLTMVLEYYMTAGTTNATTFKIRVGPGGAATVYLNSQGGTVKFGGVACSSITITEILA